MTAVYVMRKGTTINPTVVATLANAGNNVNFDCPTNPIIHDTATCTDTHRMFTYISTDDSNNDTFIQQLQGSDSAGTQYSNLENTEGYKIKCYDSISGEGIRLNSTASDHNYYVLINSDNGLTHHFARITQFTTDDVSGDSFEFEPRLGSSITKNTKFMVFKGDDEDESTIVAVSSGILATEITAGSTTYRMNKSLLCSKPLFYFHNSRLDKKNQLDHNKKYYVKYASSQMSSATINSFTTNTFITSQDYGFLVKDYSKFNIKTTLVDNLKTLDDPTNTNSYNSTKQTSNEGLTLANNDFTDYDESFYNARRDDDNVKSALNLVGPYRYLHYGYSPETANEAPMVLSTNLKESYGRRGGYAESKIVDTSRIMSSKVGEFEAFRVRQQQHRGEFFEWFPLKATVKANVTGNEYTFTTEEGYDLANLLSANDEVMVGSRVVRLASSSPIDSFNTSAFTQDITFTSSSRLDTESSFSTSSYTLSAGDRLYRRAFSSSKNNLLTTFPFVEGRESQLRIVFLDKNYAGLEATVTGSSKDQKYLTLSFTNAEVRKSSTAFTSLEYISGQYIIEVERFNGEIEQIEIDKNMGMSTMTISGRDNYSKLISPIVNRNSNFSEDVIYSTMSPHNKLELVGVLDSGNDLNFNSKTFDLTSSITVNSLANTKLFVKYTNGVVAYIGEGASNTTTRITLKNLPLTEAYGTSTHNEVQLWKEIETNYILNKALSSNNKLPTFATSLGGNSDKGLLFSSGEKLDGTLLSGSTTSRTSGVDSNAVGFHIQHPTSIGKEEAFQAKLSDGGTNYETFETVNTLIDFTVLNTSTVDGKTTIELAPYLPVTLGRVDHNDYDTYDVTLTTIGTTTGSDGGFDIDGKKYLDITPSNTSTIKAVADVGLPIYLSSIFVGYCTQVVCYNTVSSGADTWRVFLDRPVNNFSSGETISTLGFTTAVNNQYSGKNTHNLYLVNGEHLHGGKMVTLLNSLYGVEAGVAYGADDMQKPTYYNYIRPTTALSHELVGTYIEKYGVPLYKINHIEKGIFNRKTQAIASDYHTTDASPTEKEEVGRASDANYYDGSSSVQYYASAYKMNQGRSSTALEKIPSRFRETSHLHLPVEERGYFPASGSLFWDYIIHEASHTRDKVLTSHDPTLGGRVKSNFYIKDFLEQLDPKTARLFLFATSDLLPYSSLRDDSLFYSNRDLKNFSLYLLNKPTEDTTSDKHSKYGGAGKAKKYLDSDYDTAAILEYDVEDITKMTTFGLMRLTEVLFDSNMNQINPEHLPDKKKTMRVFNYHYYEFTDLGTTFGFRDSDDAILTTSDVSSSLSANDIICDSDGNMIGEVSSVSTTTITLKNLYHGDSTRKIVKTTSSGGIATGNLFKAVKHQAAFSGHGDAQNVNKLDGSIQPLVALFHGGNYSSDAFTDEAGQAFNVGSTSAGHESHLALPMVITNITFDSEQHNGHSSLLLKQYNDLKLHTDSPATAASFLKSGLVGMVLDRFDISGGDTLSSAGTVMPPINNSHLREYSATGKNFTIINYGMATRPNRFATTKLDNNGGGLAASSDVTTDAEGIYLGFKLRVKLPAKESTNPRGPSGTTHYKYILNSSTYPYLDYVKDLTGCYLASEAGTEYATGTAVAQPAIDADTQQHSMQNVSPTFLGYVVSHEIDSGNSTKRHILILDQQLTAGYYRVMQPNETCTYEYTPSRIKLNTLSSEYTKMPYKDETYSATQDYHIRVESSHDRSLNGSFENVGHNEGVLSMYCTVDLDGKIASGTTEHIVSRSPLLALYQFADMTTKKAEIPSTLCVSDGNTTFKTSTEIDWLGTGDGETIGRGLTITFGEHKLTKGVVSVSDTITITTNKNLKGKPIRAVIGSGVTIGEETETLINNLFEENDIEFTTGYTDDYPLVVAPNLKGVDLFSAINYLIEKKNKQLIYDNDKFSIKDQKDSAFSPKIKITDMNNDLQIINFSQSDVLFDFYNEVRVYSKDKIAIRKNGTSISKRGRKVLEVNDDSLSTQEEVDSRAYNLLKLHSSSNKKVSLELGHRSLGQIRPSDIIELELLQEGITSSKYVILEMEHTQIGTIKLELGKFTKGLTDRFAEILKNNKKIEANARSEAFNNVRTSRDYFGKIGITERKLIVKKRANASANSFNLGFEQTLGFALNLGLSTGGNTLTTILEEEF
jgi:hypothetical protein